MSDSALRRTEVSVNSRKWLSECGGLRGDFSRRGASGRITSTRNYVKFFNFGPLRFRASGFDPRLEPAPLVSLISMQPCTPSVRSRIK
jgi:hypothetical protein